MTMELEEIQWSILGYLQGLYPQTVMSSDPVTVFCNMIGTKISAPQVESALKELEEGKLIGIYESSKLNLTEVSALGGESAYREMEDAKAGGYVSAAYMSYPPHFFLESIEKTIKLTKKSAQLTKEEIERSVLSKMLQAFGVMAAIFTLIITGIEITSGVFGIWEVIYLQLGPVRSLLYVAGMVFAIMAPIGLIGILLAYIFKRK